MTETVTIFMHFLRRDFYVIKQRIRILLVNYSIAYPAVYAIAFGYIVPNIFFGANSGNSTVILAGNILVPIILIVNRLAIELLFDFEGNRFVAYQATLMNPRLVFIERILFGGLLACMFVLPFYPVAKIILGAQFDTSNAAWFEVLIMLLSGSLCISAYQTLVVCALKDATQLENFWIRFNQILITLGGFWIPQVTIAQFSPLLGKLVLLNPYLYVTEGLRRALIGGDVYTSIPVCVGMLTFFTALFVCAGLYFFKRKLDHI